MNKYHSTLSRLPKIREAIGSERADCLFAELIVLADEITSEMDGVNCPATSQAIINRFGSIANEIGSV